MKSRFAVFALLSLLVITGFGCSAPQATTPVPPDNSALKPFVLEGLNADDVALIKRELAKGMLSSFMPYRVDRSNDWVVPDGVDPMQIEEGFAFSYDGSLFAYVEQPNSNNPLWRASGESVFGAALKGDSASVNFAGVLFSIDAGKTWRRSFSIPVYPFDQRYEPDGMRPFNPIGMFV